MKLSNFVKWMQGSAPTQTAPSGAAKPPAVQAPGVPRPTPDFDNPNMTLMMFWPNSQTHGWADLQIRLRLSPDDAEYRFLNDYVSYLEDSFTQFIDACIAMAEDQAEASVFSDMEPQRAEFRFSRLAEPAHSVSLTLLEWTPYCETQERLVYDIAQDWQEIGTTPPIALKHLMDDVLWIADELEKAFGTEGYCKVWGHPYPSQKRKRLQGLRAAFD